MVGIAGSSADLLSSRLWDDRQYAAAMIGDTTMLMNDVPVGRQFTHKLQVFIVTASSAMVLDNILKNVKKSLWWNHMATFLILGDPTSKYECSNAHDILWTAWETDLLNGKFLCLDQSNRTLIYSYNPYSIYAPDPWKFVNSYPGKNNHPWTLFVGNYQELVSDNCQDLEFKTTNDLNGYEISYIARDLTNLWQTKLNKTGIDSFGGPIGEKAKMLYLAVNASARRVRQFGFNSKSRCIFGLDCLELREVVDGHSEISLNQWYWTDIQNMSMLYPLWQSGLSVTTQYRDYESEVSKLWRVIDIGSWIGVFVVTLITLICFKYCLHQPLFLALLNIVRLACNSSVPAIPNNVAVRIYLACVFVFLITMQGIFQGKLASLLTKQVHLPNVETMQELVDSPYTIYVYKGWLNYFTESGFEGRVISTLHAGCVKHVLNTSTAACINEGSALTYFAAKYNLHVSRNNIFKKYYTYAIRDDWPLEPRLNEILSSLTESGIVNYKWEKNLDKSRQILNAYRELNKDKSFEVIMLGELSFAFVILGVGLGCATISFIIETAIKRDYAKVIHRVITLLRGLFHSR